MWIRDPQMLVHVSNHSVNLMATSWRRVLLLVVFPEKRHFSGIYTFISIKIIWCKSNKNWCVNIYCSLPRCGNTDVWNGGGGATSSTGRHTGETVVLSEEWRKGFIQKVNLENHSQEEKPKITRRNARVCISSLKIKGEQGPQKQILRVLTPPQTKVTYLQENGGKFT